MYLSAKRFISNLLVMERFLIYAIAFSSSSVIAAVKDSEIHNDVLVIEEEDKPEKNVPQKNSFFDPLMDSIILRSDTFLQGSYQLVEPADKPVRMLGSLWATLSLEPSEVLSLQLSTIARVPLDFSWRAGTGQMINVSNAFLDLYDSFIKIRSRQASMSLGYLLIPWVNTRGSAVLDRLNPIDYRRGQDFTSTLLGRIPQVGVYYQTSVFATSVDAVILLHYNPSQGSLVASEQNGMQIGRYQGALLRNGVSASNFTADRYVLREKQPWLQTPVLALRAKTKLSNIIDMGTLFSFGFNEVPSLDLPKSMFHQRLLDLGMDLSVNLGVIVLKSELLMQPKFSDWGGKTTILASPSGSLRSVQLPSLTLAVAVDTEYGDSFSGSLELIDTIWIGIPQNELVLGVESLLANNTHERNLHRLAFATAAQSAFLNQKVLLRVKGEVGLTQQDILARVDASYRWDSLGLYAGIYGNLFLGIPGSPGWFRQDATSAGLYVGHQI
jgi:hypothetical protein